MKTKLFTLAIAALSIGLLSSCEKDDPTVSITGVTLEPATLEITVGDADVKLTATVAPENATNKTVSWSSDKTNVATVDNEGNVHAVAAGSATITVTTTDGRKTATCAVKVAPSPAADYVEIGGVKWATKNLGATTVAGSLATCAGDYYAWGETEPYYGTLTWNGTSGTFSDWKNGKDRGYNWQSYCGVASFTEWSTPPYDNDTKILKPDFDAAKQKLGDDWRMPTSAEFQALHDACINGSYDNTTYASPAICGESTTFSKGIYWCANYDGVAGCLFCDGTNKVFFPATGCGNNTTLQNVGYNGYYWSSSFYPYEPSYTYFLYFRSISVTPQDNSTRIRGCSVRPVSK